MRFFRHCFFSKEDRVFSKRIKKLTGFYPKKLLIYKEAFTHSNFRKTNRSGEAINYQRLEFLGDAVLGTIVANILFKKFAKSGEGFLSRMRAEIIKGATLSKIGKKLNVLSFLESDLCNGNLLGKSIQADLVESILGAIYLDKGYKSCHHFFEKKILESFINLEGIKKKIESQKNNYKGKILEWSQKNQKSLRYDTRPDENFAKNKSYVSICFINNAKYGQGRGSSKKQSQQKAAQKTLQQLKIYGNSKT